MEKKVLTTLGLSGEWAFVSGRSNESLGDFVTGEDDADVRSCDDSFFSCFDKCACA